jgi:TRAP-type transport system periplasmic protein
MFTPSTKNKSREDCKMINRRRFLQTTAVAGALAVASPAVLRAQGAEFVFKWGCGLPAAHPLIVRAIEASGKIKQETNGRVDIQMFSDSQLGSDTEMLAQVRAGGIDIYTAGAPTIVPLVPLVGIINMAFAFKTSEDGWKALDGDLGKVIEEAITKANLYMFSPMWGQGYRQLTSKKPINHPDELRGFKIRVPPSPILLSLFQTLGASPTSMNVSELYTALQTGIVEGQENPLSIIHTRHFYEVQKHCALTNHVWDINVQVANRASWNRLSDSLKQVVVRHLGEAGLKQREDVQKANDTLQADLEKKGMVFNKPDIDAFRAKLKSGGFYDQWRKTYGEQAWKTLEQYTGSLS